MTGPSLGLVGRGCLFPRTDDPGPAGRGGEAGGHPHALWPGSPASSRVLSCHSVPSVGHKQGRHSRAVAWHLLWLRPQATTPSPWWVTLHAHPTWHVWLHQAQGLCPPISPAHSTSPLEMPKQACPGPLHARLLNCCPPRREIYQQDHGFYKTMERERCSACSK